jgi:acyl-CoA thioester hydrolase
MAKPDPWRLYAASYPIRLEMQTRFQDLDLNGHLNNVAFAALFENARVQMNRSLRPWDDRPEDERTMVANVEINYLREGSFPEPVTIHSGVGRIGNSSWSFLQAMIQKGACIATCDTVVVCRSGQEAKPLRADLIDALTSMLVHPATP